MASGGVLPDRDPPVRTETVHSSERTRVTRLFLPGHTVIRKEPLGPDPEGRLRHESAMLERLRGVAGVVQLAEVPQHPGSILMVDAGGASLAEVAKPLAVDVLIGLAVDLARAVAGMHRRGVMHRDISPANIVVSSDGAVCLVDFALASPLAEIRPEFTHHAEIVGTLAYLAPEQTGRTARLADQRADLYALGATLYELATGEPPFGSGDPLRLVHDHLARVPVPPTQVNSAIPKLLSAIIMHLLEKEPDNRYQTADGAVYDLERLRIPDAAVAQVGEHDIPMRLMSPSRLVGRADEVTALRAAFAEALAGRCRGVLVAGGPGVGKTALADELRPVATGRDGWFVAGKFDAYRRDLESDAVHQALRALGRLLLAEPEDELATVRGRILAAAGPNAGLLTAGSAEFAALLAVPPDPGDPLTAQVRAQRAGANVLRAVASRERPVAMFLDDLQWAGRVPLGLIDLLLTEEPVEGLLLVGTYREGDVDGAHPLAAPLSRWRAQAGVRYLYLDNLSASSLAAMVAEMLHMGRAAVAGLAEVLGPHTSGNPYETVELLNALRRSGVLTATADGWRWDAAAVRAHLGRSEVAGLLAARADAMPEQAQQLVEAMACLGGRADLSLLRAATAQPADVVDQALAPALGEGLLVAVPGAEPAVRFRHDRIREAVLGGLDPRRRRAMQLAMARRLASVPELFAVAAEQYLPVADAVGDAVERRQVAGLLRRTAGQAGLIGDYALVNALLTTALPLIDPEETSTLAEVHTGRHSALYSLGRLEEADEEYHAIRELGISAAERAGATAVQVRSLTYRKRIAEAVELGIESLGELGVAVPAADRVHAGLDQRLDYLRRWLDHTDAADDLPRPDITDPALLATARLIGAMLPVAYFADYSTHAWLSLEAMRIWIDHGPSRILLGSASYTVSYAVEQRGEYAAGSRTARRLLAVGEARGYEPGISEALFVSAVISWFYEPIEHGVRAARRAREGLIAGGDLANAGYTYYPTVMGLLDCAPSLDACVAEAEAGLAFMRRTGNEQSAEALDTYRRLAGVLRGETGAAAETVPTDRYAGNPLALFLAHINHAIAAAVFGDPVGLERHSAAAMPLLPAARGLYPTAVAHLLRGLALAGQARAADGARRSGVLAELDGVSQWLAARAAGAPDNFLHMQRLLEAEQGWAVGDFRAAAVAFDAARREAAQHERTWHRALIAEHTGRFYLAYGAEQSGYELLARARHDYAAWGATAKAAQLDWAYPALRPSDDATAGDGPGPAADLPERRAAVTTGTVDLLGIVSASQALSSETSIGQLHARVSQVLSAMTGATGVHLPLWSEDQRRWRLPASDHDSGTVLVSGAGQERVVPMSVLRYVQRTREPLVVADVPGDDRFARDPHFAEVARCSLLAVPVLSRGLLRAVLVLENRLIRGAFTTARLDAVQLIAGQLAVSLDNAQLYAELTASRSRIVAAADQARRRIERDLHDGAQQRLISLALRLRAAQEAAPPALAAELDRAVGEAAGALEELRETARGIHPAILTEGGLRPALRVLARRSPIPVDLQIPVRGRLPEPVEISAYYLVAEALANAAKHARSSAISVEAEITGEVLRVTVRDDGVGGADFTSGTGLAGLKDRVEAIGGRISLDSPRGAGTSLHVELPITGTNGGITNPDVR